MEENKISFLINVLVYLERFEKQVMGYAYSYKCKSCGYEETFNQGNGYLIHPQSFQDYMDRNRKIFHYKVHRKILNLSKEDNCLGIEASFRVYKCPKCNLLFDKTHVTVVSDGKILHTSRFRCSECSTGLKLTNIHRLKRAICPVCRKRTFTRLSYRSNLFA